MSLAVFSTLTYLIPLLAAALGLITTFDNRNKGVSRNLFLLFLVCIGIQTLFDFLTKVDLDIFLSFGSFVFMPAIMSYGVILYIFANTLLDRKYEASNYNKLQLIPIALTILILIFISISSSPGDYLTYIKYKYRKSYESLIYLDVILGLRVGLHLLLIFFYIFKINSRFSLQKSIYGKFYASYEMRNELCMKRIMYSLIIFSIIQIFNHLNLIDSDLITVVLNTVSAILIWIMAYSGNNQLDIKRYRMYKLLSHEEELGI